MVKQTLGRYFMTEVAILALQAANTVEIGAVYQTTDLADTRYYYGVRTNKVSYWKDDADLVEAVATNQFVKGISNTDAAVSLNRDAQTGVVTPVLNLSPDAENIITRDANGLLKAVAAPPFATGVNSTGTLDLNIVAGKIEGTVKRSADANNAFDLKADGGYVQSISVHTNSQEYLRKNADGTLEVIARPRIQKVDATTLTSPAAFVAAVNAGTFVPNKPLEIGDLVFTAGGNYEYMGNGTLPIAVSDLVTVEGDEANTATYRDAITGGAGWDYDKISGVGQTLPSTQANNNVVAGADGRLFVDVDQTTTTVGGVSKTIEAALNDLNTGVVASVNAVSNGIELEAGTNKAILGGALTKDTTVAQATKRMLWTGGAFGIQKPFLEIWSQDPTTGDPIAPTGNWSFVFATAGGDLGVMRLTAGQLPN
jgi:hypothetical protein